MPHAWFVPRLLSPHQHHHNALEINRAQTTPLAAYFWNGQNWDRLSNPEVEVSRHSLRLVGVSQEILDGSTVALVGWFVCGPWCAAGGFLAGYALSLFRHR